MNVEEPGAHRVEAWNGRSHPLWLYRFVQFMLGPLIRLVFNVRRRGHRTIPKRGPVILATNHASVLDPVIVVASMHRTVHHLAKHTLFRRWFWRFFFETLGGQIPVDRDRGGNRAAVDAAVTALRRGVALGIYPEGGRSPDGRLRMGRTGVARIALTAGVPIYPVAVMGPDRVLPKWSWFPRLFRRTEVRVGPPIWVPLDPAAADDPRRCRELTDRVMIALGDLIGQVYDPADPPPLLTAADRVPPKR
jgi:1-acyl-sn-glycerol-3-phosphate acyltransferase